MSTVSDHALGHAGQKESSPMKMEAVVSRAGLEPDGPQDKAQLIDSNNRQKRSNRSFRRFEVHDGYTGYEFVSSKRGRK